MICLRAASRHFSYGEIHSGRAGLGGELTRMIGIVRPSIPLRVRSFRVRTMEAYATWTSADATAYVPKQWHHRRRVPGTRT